ncbi:MAG: SpoVR family protein, partial [Caulobacteraceae bacterium]|nr:SpoVR family protein [Caulobacteraceae bacterium]
DTMMVLRDIWANFRDESFIGQYLSPHLMRRMRMFHLRDDPARAEGVRVEAIQNERGYRRIRRELARRHDVGWIEPNIEVVDVDLAGDRRLILHHGVVGGRLLAKEDANRVLQHLANLWGYDVLLCEVGSSDTVLEEHACSPRGMALAAA